MKTGLVKIFTTPVTVSTKSQAIVAEDLLYASVQMVVTGSSPIGTMQFEISNDVVTQGSAATPVPTNWTPIGSAVALSATGTFVIPKTDLCYQYIRVDFTKTSGTISVTGVVKTIGA